ncbi:MAG: DUF1290 domain-containing protein [Armatimonadota bacterium]
MWLPLLALIVGFVAVYLPAHANKILIPGTYAEYIGVAVVAGLDSVMGAIRSSIEGRFNDRVFFSGFFTNAAIAALLLYLLGDKLQIQYIALAIIIALVIRIYNNIGFIRRYVIARLFEKRFTADNTFPEP